MEIREGNVKIVCFASLKGGVGKTSGAVFLAQALARRGRVLAVDIDANNNLTDYFCRDVDPAALEQANVYHVVTGRDQEEGIRGIIEHHIDVLPATPMLHRAGLELARDPGSLLRFPAALRRLPYDFIVLDTPPALVLELTIGLYSADLVLGPVSFGRWTVQGFGLLRAEVERVGQIGRTPRLLALPSIVTEKEDEGLRALNSWIPTRSTIIKSAAVRTAGTRGRALREGTRSWEDFERLAREVVNG